MFEKYLNLIKTHKDNKKEIKDFLESLGLNVVGFNINGDTVDFIIPSSFKLRIHNKKQDILNFLKSKNLKSKNL
jgi:hypothetical protein